MFESVYGALRLMDEAGAVPLLIREKKGVKEYNSVIFVRKDSPITSMADLKGKVIAFEDPDSTSSYMLPRKILENEGLILKKSRKPVPGAVAYYFSKDDDNTVTQVASGKRAHAGGIKKCEGGRQIGFPAAFPRIHQRSAPCGRGPFSNSSRPTQEHPAGDENGSGRCECPEKN